jgi:ribokinase
VVFAKKAMVKPIAVVGSINLDLAISAPRLPTAGETILGTGFGVFAGGKGANQAAAAARLGYATFMIGRVGDDPYAETLLAELSSAGVHIEAVTRAHGPSGVAVIVSAAAGENSIIVAPGANDTLLPDELESSATLIGGAAAVLTQLEIPLETVEALARMTTRAGVPLILDPAPARPLPPELLARLDWITPNETEALLLTGASSCPSSLEDIRELAEHFLSLGPRNILLKLGVRGAYLATSDGLRTMIPAYPVTAIDTTAAGDAFNAGFAVALARGSCPTEAAQFATAVAALSVTRRGALPSLPTQDEVAAFLAIHSTMQQETLL